VLRLGGKKRKDGEKERCRLYRYDYGVSPLDGISIPVDRESAPLQPSYCFLKDTYTYIGSYRVGQRMAEAYPSPDLTECRYGNTNAQPR